MDGTLDNIHGYEPPLLQLTGYDGVSEPDKDIYDAMNKTIQMASGDVVSVLNFGDFYYDERDVGVIVNASIVVPVSSFGSFSMSVNAGLAFR